MEFNNDAVNAYLKDKNLSVIEYDDQRPWGGWYIIDRGDSYKESQYFGNETERALVENLEGGFDKKVLRVVPNTLLSLQYHGIGEHLGHSEICMAQTKMRVVMSKRSAVGLSKEQLDQLLDELVVVELNPGATLFIRSGFIHAYANPFNDEVYLIESRISPIKESSDEREANIVRIYDQTNRNGTPSFPKELFERIMNPNMEADVVVKAGEVWS